VSPAYFTVGSPTLCNAHSSAENFRGYRQHGNHKSARDHPDELYKVFLKDCRRGHALAFDPQVLPFIYHAHLTPLGIVDIDNKWKKSRLVFDSSFRPHFHSMGINDWTDTANEPALEFPGCLATLLAWIWNLRISYPDQRILLGDNDIQAAFRLIKYHPSLVSLHLYTVGDEFLGAATGTTFGDAPSPANFEPLAIARKEHARWLYSNRPRECLARAAAYVQDMVLPPEATPSEAALLAKANQDTLNPGAFRPDGSRLPPPYPHQIDDCLFADVIAHIRLASAASIVALEDVAGAKHPCQPPVLSHEKLELSYAESRLMLGHTIDTRDMTVHLSARRREKLIRFIVEEGWLSRTSADLREVAVLHGLLLNGAEFCDWAKCQFFLLQRLLRHEITRRYDAVSYHRKRQGLPPLAEGALPPQDFLRRTQRLVARNIATTVWRSRTKIPIPSSVHTLLRHVLDSLQAGDPWRKLMGHMSHCPSRPRRHRRWRRLESSHRRGLP
jgi:hypothetical protein